MTGRAFRYFQGLSLLLVSGLLLSPLARAQGYQSNPAKEFIMSCTYGVLAGTLVGTALLAFEDQPGDNLNKVARGASIGLYAGILLGLYVVYAVPEDDDAFDPYNQPGLPPMEGRRIFREPRFQAYLNPTWGEDADRIDGMTAQLKWTVF